MSERRGDLFAGPFTQADADRHGLGRSVIRRLVREGDLRRVLHGVYAGTHLPDTPVLRARAAARVLPPGAVVCGATAAWLLGVPPPGPPGPLEVAVPPGTAAPRRRGCTGRVMILAPADVVGLGPVRVTSGPRTAADLGRALDRRDAVVALDALLRAGLVNRRQLDEAVVRFTGRPGVRRLAEAVRLADPRSAGAAESVLRLALLDAGLARDAVPGYEVGTALGGVLHRFAIAWPRLRVALSLGRPPPGAPEGGPGGRLPGLTRRWRSIGGRSWLVVGADDAEVMADPGVIAAQLSRLLADGTRGGRAA